MLLGAGGGSLLGLLTVPDRADGTARALAPADQVAPSTTTTTAPSTTTTTTLGGTTTSSSGPSTTTPTT